MIVVYDFDKTLTTKDTVLGFFIACSKKDYTFFYNILVFFSLMVAHKIKLISNNHLKKIGVELFLKGKKKADLLDYGKTYSKKIPLNSVYHRFFKKEISNPYIVSGSFLEYLLPIFPNGNLICSEIEYAGDRVKTLKNNCYGLTKRILLEKRGITHIDQLYTDSLSDLPLAQIAGNIYLVKGENIVKCRDVHHFKKLLKRPNVVCPSFSA